MSFWTRMTLTTDAFLHRGDCQIDSDGSIDNYDTEGATQTATPEMAGIQALINQANGGRQGMPNYYYYSLAAAQNTAACNSSNITSTACAFQDVTSGSNLICATLACAEGVLILHCRTRRAGPPVRVTIWLPDWARRTQPIWQVSGAQLPSTALIPL